MPKRIKLDLSFSIRDQRALLFVEIILFTISIFFMITRGVNPFIEDSFHKISLNTATELQLTSLPGIGPKRARLIIEYRRRSGGFMDKEELRKIKGIGEKRFKAIKDLVEVD
jgi:competence ComEA-like helix-hairpin-helix protein